MLSCHLAVIKAALNQSTVRAEFIGKFSGDGLAAYFK